MPLDFLAFNADDLINEADESELKQNELKLVGDISTINSPADFISNISSETQHVNQNKSWSKIDNQLTLIQNSNDNIFK